MKNTLNVISTVAAVLVLSYCWGMFAADQGINDFVTAVGSFSIGFFGGGVIYRWLSTESLGIPPDEESGL